MNTIKLYQKDVYLKKFHGRIEQILPAEERDLLVLDQTAFFPEGGGQPWDRGTLGGFAVEKVWEENNQVFHQIPSGSGFREGDVIEGVLDWPARFRNMQRHCGEHILSGIFYQECGGVNRGFHMGEEYMTIDISLEEDPDCTVLTPEILQKVETLANQAVWANLPVSTRTFESREEAAALPMRKQLALEEDITIVCVGSLENPADCVACCGTHPSTSGQVGLIKIYKMENYKGMFRIYFDAGADALSDYQQKHQLVDQLNKRYSASTGDLMDKILAQEEKNKAVRTRLHHLRQVVIREKTEETAARLRDGQTLTVMEFEGLDLEDLTQLGRPLTEEIQGLLVLICREASTLLFFSNGKRVDCGKMVRETASIYNGKGGGNNTHARVILPKQENIDVYMDLLERHLRP